MGARFRWLLASSFVSNLGDGIGLAAGPLLVASLTDRPSLVALATLLQQLPWLLFGLHAGVLADRADRRTLVVGVNLVRAAVLAVLATTIVTGTITVAVVLVAMFALGTAETFADTTTRTLLPMLVDKRDLAIGNAGTGLRQHDRQPDGRAADRCVPVHRRLVGAVRVAGGVRRCRRAARPPDRVVPTAASRRAGERPHRDRRGGPVGLAPRCDPHAAHHRAVLQHHVRRDVGDHGALRHRPARARRHRVRCDHHGRRARRRARHDPVRAGSNAGSGWHRSCATG